MRRLFAVIPLVAFAYVLIGQPVVDQLSPGLLNHKVLWPALFALTLLLAVRFRRDLNLQQLKKPPISVLLAFLCFAGVSVLWAYSPADSLKRWIGAAMIVVTIVLPLTLKKPRVDIVDGLFWLYTIAVLINAIFVLTTPAMISREGVPMGRTGYYYHKQYLGMCVSVAIIMAAHMILWRRRRIVPAIVTLSVSVWLLLEAESRASMGFAILAPMVAALTLLASRQTNLSLALVVSILPASFMALSLFIPNIPERLSFHVFGDPTFSGRTLIWDWVETQAALKPLFGWGFHSFWFVPNSPSFTAPGFISEMPASHSGYLDLRLETGYLGIGLFLAYLVASLHSLERLRKEDAGRTLYFLSLFIYIMTMNLMETLWFTSFDPLWTLFLILSASTVESQTTRSPVSKISQLTKASSHRFPHSAIRSPG